MITFASSYGSIQLSNPILGDAEQLNYGTSIKITMSKNVHSTIKNQNHSKFLLTFQNLTIEKLDAFKVWFQNSRGLEHTYTDYNSDAHVGFILNEPIEGVADGRSKSSGASGCSVYDEHGSLTIEFEAVN